MTGTVVDWPRGNDIDTAIDDTENEANAWLIASGPDLLAALKQWISMALNSGLEGCDEIIETASLAIAKATTGQREEL